MADADVYRLSVRAPGVLTSVDLLLPSLMELGEAIPYVVELVGVRRDGTEHWQLARFDGSVLDETMTLRENGVRDGDLVLLDNARPTSGALPYDTIHCVREASPAGDDRCPRRLATVAFLWAAALAAITLAWPGTSPPSSRAVVAGIVAVGAAVAAVVNERLDIDPSPTLVPGSVAVAFATLAGYLAVPGGPAPPNFFLAAAVCSAMSAVLLHTTTQGDTVFMAIIALSLMSASATAIVAIRPAPLATVGAALAAASMAMLGVAARAAIRLTGLSPRIPSGSDSPADEEEDGVAVDATRAEHGHRTLTALLAGFALSAALGSALVAVGAPPENTVLGAAFTAVVAAALIARAAHQRGLSRSMPVLSAGMISATAAFALIASSMPQHRSAVCLGAVVLGSGALIMAHGDVVSQMSPFARRGLEVTEYLVLASIVPLGCWICGMFGLVRGLSLL